MSRCEGCGGEDCVCCEVYVEQQADNRYYGEPDTDSYYNDNSISYYQENEED